MGMTVGMVPSMTTAPTQTRTLDPARALSSPIDMFTPAQTCEFLRLDDGAVLDLVNQGRLAAYNLGGHIRFKTSDVRATAHMLTLQLADN